MKKILWWKIENISLTNSDFDEKSKNFYFGWEKYKFKKFSKLSEKGPSPFDVFSELSEKDLHFEISAIFVRRVLPLKFLRIG